MLAFLVFIIGIGFGLSYYMDAPEILFFAVLISIVMNVWAYWFSHKTVIRMTGAKPADPKQYSELYNLTENLAITAGLPMPKLYIVNDDAPNAFATGRNEKHAAVAVTTGLLSMLERDELEGVIAHELSHIGNKDMLIGTIAVVLVGVVSIVARMVLHGSFGGGGGSRRSSNNGGGGGGLLGLILMIVGIVIAPLLATMLRLGISRKREFLADASGALLTRYPEGLARALEKISTYDRPMRRTSEATSHLFFADPHYVKPTQKVGFFACMFMTHPPVYERVKALRDSRG